MNSKINKTARFIDLGVIQYKEAWDYQTSLFEKILAVKTENRTLAEGEQRTTENFLLFCQHPNVYTLGKSGKQENLLVALEDLPAIEASYYHTNRGGDITFHGPGQIVGYPIIDLENFFTDIHQYMRLMEEAVIQTVKEFGIDGARINGMAGVWLDPDTTRARKICAMGVKSSRWVTMHGFALNVNTDLEYFKHIVPCGISDKAVTSIQQEAGKAVDIKLVEDLLKKNIAALFGMTLTDEGMLKSKQY